MTHSLVGKKDGQFSSMIYPWVKLPIFRIYIYILIPSFPSQQTHDYFIWQYLRFGWAWLKHIETTSPFSTCHVTYCYLSHEFSGPWSSHRIPHPRPEISEVLPRTLDTLVAGDSSWLKGQWPIKKGPLLTDKQWFSEAYGYIMVYHGISQIQMARTW